MPRMKTKPVIIIVVILAVIGAFYLFRWFLPVLDQEVPIPPRFQDNTNNMKLNSKAFTNGEFIPSKYTCDGKNVSPPLSISKVPEETKSLVLIMDDPDVPKAVRPEGVFDHFVVYNIDPLLSEIGEGDAFGTTGLNGSGNAKYTGSCPPTGYQPTMHRYIFKLYATDLANLNFIKAPTKQEILTAIKSHIIAEAQLTGLYDRTKKVQ